MTLVRAENLGKRFARTFPRGETLIGRLKGLGRASAEKSVWALRGAAFELRRGENLGVQGPNGSGKSTLLRLVAGIMAPTEDGSSLKGGPPRSWPRGRPQEASATTWSSPASFGPTRARPSDAGLGARFGPAPRPGCDRGTFLRAGGAGLFGRPSLRFRPAPCSTRPWPWGRRILRPL